MKTKHFIMIVIFSIIINISKAQAPFISNYMWMQATGNCATYNWNTQAGLHNFANGDVINGTINFGDGNTLSLSPHTITSSNDSAFYNGSHTYAASGTYTVTYVASGPGGVIGNFQGVYTVNTNCIDYSGYVYVDANSNCVYDVGESPVPNSQVILTTTNGTYSAYSNSVGFYQFLSVPFLGTNSTISSNSPVVVCPTTSSYTVTTATANNLNFGISNTPILSFTIFNSFSQQQGCATVFDFWGNLQHCNVANGSTINFTIDYGDGTILNTTGQTSSSGVACDTMYIGNVIAPQHTYAAPGTYTVTITASYGALSTTMSTSLVVQNCSIYSGYAFLDANGNCTMDVGELPLSNQAFLLQDPTATYWAISDAAGYYEFSIPLNTGSSVSIQPSGTTIPLSCPALSPYTTAASSGSNINFGFTPPPPTLQVSGWDSLNNCGQLSLTTYFTYQSCNLPTGGTYVATIDYGDGTGVQTVTGFNLNSFFGCDNYYSNSPLTHTYPSYGTYYITRTVTCGTYTSSMIDTLILGPCTNFSGTTYHDANNNCILDAGEQLGYQYIEVHESGNIVGSAWSDASGVYNVQLPFVAGSTYVISAPSFPWGTSACFSVSCPIALTYTVNTISASNLDFGYTQSNTNFDNAISGINAGCCGILNAGSNRTFKLYYHNILCGSNNGEVSLTLEPNMTLNSAYPAPSSIVGNVVKWNFYALNNTTWNNSVEVNVLVPFLNPSGQPYVIGDAICLDAEITSTSTGTDQDLTNNTLTQCFYVGTSYDPNDKQVMPKGEGVAGNIQQYTDLEYMIRFQNTGTAPAHHVKITDTLDSDLDFSTVEIVGSSHYMIATQNGANLQFDFPNIMLPDSGANMEASQGFVRFKVKHNTTAALGTVINNKAYIYFDVNAPIITNTTVNTLYKPSSVGDIDKNAMAEIYPNPASDILKIRIDAAYAGGTIEIFNSMGSMVYSHKQSTTSNSIPLNGLSKGPYFVKVCDKDGNCINKQFVIK